jgi:hypothetical protein
MIVVISFFVEKIVPETGSTILREIVEALFITHAETKLNSSGCLVGNNSDNFNHQNVAWCEGLVDRPVPSLIRTAPATTTTTTTLKAQARSK